MGGARQRDGRWGGGPAGTVASHGGRGHLSRRSVLFIIADDWSPIARCYGNGVIKTPNVDALAERGVVFDYAFCTSPSCAVSRACILTGQHSHTHGQCAESG